jgi:hypothetical protein
LRIIGLVVAIGVGVYGIAEVGATTSPGASTVTTTAAPGVTLTQDSAQPWFAGTAVANAQAILQQSSTYVAQSIMGWGTSNPEPRPGVFNWASLDQRIQFILASGATPVITLAGAPDWMKGGTPGETDWSNINVAPTPAHYADFAALAVDVARRYPEVHYFQVWNELKGFWDNATNNWDIADYTDLYNTVYRALKAYNPAIQVGGPYVRIVTWAAPSAGGFPSGLVGPWGTVDQRSLDAISYWLTNADGADFLAIDGSTDTKDNASLADPFGATDLYAATDRWLEQKTELPIWWSEYYAVTPQMAHHPTDPEWAALSAQALIEIATSGASVALMWDPEQYQGSSTPGLWSSTRADTGGQPTALVSVFTTLRDYFPAGTQATLTTSPSGVLELSSQQHFVIIDTNGEWTQAVTPAGPITLSPWEIVAK